MMYKVYKITCVVNGKMYIGQTKLEIEKRFNTHLKNAEYGMHKNNLFYNAISKHGKENFTVEKIDESDTYEEILKKEIKWIAFYKSNHYKYPNVGYNSTDGGEGAVGFVMPESAKQKLREINLGKKRSKEAIEKSRKKMLGNKYSLGFKHTKETRLKMSKSRIGLRKGFKHSDETKKLIGEAGKGRPAWNAGIKTPVEERVYTIYNNASKRIRKTLNLDLMKKVINEKDVLFIEDYLQNNLYVDAVLFIIGKLNEYNPSETEKEVRHAIRNRTRSIKYDLEKADRLLKEVS
jgi:group I intron endonuclease